MSLPIREQILQALAARTGASRQLTAYDPRDLPLTVLVEGEDSAGENPYGRVSVSLPVTIARAIPLTGTKEDDWYTEANTALGNLILEIYAGGDDLGGLADGIDYTSGQTEVLTDGGTGAAVQAVITVRYQFVHGNPYSQDDLADYTDPGDPAP